MLRLSKIIVVTVKSYTWRKRKAISIIICYSGVGQVLSPVPIINLLQNLWNLIGWTMAFGKNYKNGLFSFCFWCPDALQMYSWLHKNLNGFVQCLKQVGGVIMCLRHPIYTCLGYSHYHLMGDRSLKKGLYNMLGFLTNQVCQFRKQEFDWPWFI